MESDEAISRLAFFGMACHHTRAVGKKQAKGSVAVDADDHAPKDAVFVNDMTALSIFAVRGKKKERKKWRRERNMNEKEKKHK